MDSFGARLRYERERRQIALMSISEGTGIGISLLEGLERDDVSRWPSGIFRKSFVRAYAASIGLDPDAVLLEFVERHPDPCETELTAPVVPPSAPPSGPFAVTLTIAWSGDPFGGLVADLRKRWLSRRGPDLTVWSTKTEKP